MALVQFVFINGVINVFSLNVTLVETINWV